MKMEVCMADVLIIDLLLLRTTSLPQYRWPPKLGLCPLKAKVSLNIESVLMPSKRKVKSGIKAILYQE
jgi:hypothetical protein